MGNVAIKEFGDKAVGNTRTVTFSTDTSAYASGDLVADTQEITNVFPVANVPQMLTQITLLDKADQKVALKIVFLNASQSLGTENAAPSISDANGEKVVGVIAISADDYVDLGGCAVVTTQCALQMKGATDATSLWVAIVNGTGTPTYGASDLVAQFAFVPS